MRLLRNTRLWECMSHTEAVATQLFQTFARVQAATYDYLLMRTRCYPLRLVDMLAVEQADREEAALALVTAPACTLDKFAQHWRSRHRSVTELLDETVCAELAMILHNVVGTTFCIERAHSCNLRRLKSRTMTHDLTLPDLALPHAGLSVPQSAAALLLEETKNVKTKSPLQLQEGKKVPQAKAKLKKKNVAVEGRSEPSCTRRARRIVDGRRTSWGCETNTMRFLRNLANAIGSLDNWPHTGTDRDWRRSHLQ